MGFELMNKKIFLAIAIIIALLPIYHSGVNIQATTQPVVNNNQITPEEIGIGSKLIYQITQFELGSGFDQLLQEITQDPETPDIEIGYDGSLVGSEVWFYITLEDELQLFQYDYSDDYSKENFTQKDAMQVLAGVQLGDDLSAFANLSQLSYPDDAVRQDSAYYYDSWPMSHFDTPITSDDFWDGFSEGFIDGFNWGFNDEVNGYDWAWFEWPEPDHYDDIFWFARQFGEIWGYETGREAGHLAVEEDPSDPWGTSWFDAETAEGAFKAGFLDGRDDGYNKGRDDYTTDRIPEKVWTNPYDTANLVNLGKKRGYDNAWPIYYDAGFLYEGAQEYFNNEIYWELYAEMWDTYPAGYVDGFSDGYAEGTNDGQYDHDYGSYGDNFETPEGYWDPRGDYEWGYNAGLEDGYQHGYDDGYNMVYDYGDFINGMYNYIWQAHEDGFQVGAQDYINNLGYDNSTFTLPYSSPANMFEEGCNFIYEMMYLEAYDNGWKYAFLTDRDGNDMNWLEHEGPFYYMYLPDLILSLESGSIIPVPTDIIMFKELNISLMDYDIDYEYGENTDLFSEHMSPFSIYAPESDWTELDTWDWDFDPDSDMPGVTTTIDGDIFEMVVNWEEEDGDIAFELTIRYDMTTSVLQYTGFSVDFTTETDMYFNVAMEYESDTQINLPTPDPTSWSYLIDTFSFNYELPDDAPPEVSDGLDDFKNGGEDAVGEEFMDIDWIQHIGLWNEYNVTLKDPNNPSDTSDTVGVMQPCLSPGLQILPDWDLWGGIMHTGDSYLAMSEWIGNAMDLLSDANPTFDAFRHDLYYDMSTYHDSTNNVMYLYAGISGAYELRVEMLNGDWEWEETTVSLYFKLVIWTAFDYTTGIFLGAGVEGTVDETLTSDIPTSPQFTLYADIDIRIRADLISSLASITDILTFAEMPEKDTDAPVISDVTYSPDKPTEEDTIIISANVTDESGVCSVILHYKNGTSDWQEIEMVDDGTGVYSAEIGPFSADTVVEFYITATDMTVDQNEAVDNNGGANYTIEIKGKGVLGIGFNFVDVLIMGLGLISIASLITLVKRRK